MNGPEPAHGPARALAVLGLYAAVLGLAGWVLLPGWVLRWEAECLAGAGHLVCPILRPQAQAPRPTGPESPAGRFAFTSLRRVTPDDLSALQCRDLAIMRNEIYARYGHTFLKPEWRAYFSAQSWYSPSVADATGLLNAIEKENVGRIKEREAALFC